MRILFLVSKDANDPSAAGGEIHLFTLARFLSLKGHSVTYVCRKHEGGKNAENVGSLKTVHLKPRFFPLRIFAYYAGKARGRCDVVVEQVFGGFRPPFLCTFYVKEPLVAVWYQRHKKIFFAQFAWPVAALLSISESFLALLYRKTTVVTDSSDQKTELVSIGIPKHRISVLPPGPNFTVMKLEEETKKNGLCRKQFPRLPLLVTLGNLRRYKSFHHAVLAANILVNKYPNLQLTVAGKKADAKYEQELHRFVEDLSLQKNVSIEVNVSEERKRELLENALALVVPSPVEGFGMVVLEAGALGTPSIVSDGVPHDAVVNGYNGLRYEFGDITGLVQAVDKLVTDKQLWRTLSENAVRHSDKFNWHNAADDFERLLMKTVPIS